MAALSLSLRRLDTGGAHHLAPALEVRFHHRLDLVRASNPQARLLTLKCAWLLDRHGHHGAWREVSLVKVAVPNMPQRVADRAIQVFGAMGGTDDAPIHYALSYARLMRIGDGPDEVHLRQIFRMETPPAWKIDESPYITYPRRT